MCLCSAMRAGKLRDGAAHASVIMSAVSVHAFSGCIVQIEAQHKLEPEPLPSAEAQKHRSFFGSSERPSKFELSYLYWNWWVGGCPGAFVFIALLDIRLSIYLSISLSLYIYIYIYIDR